MIDPAESELGVFLRWLDSGDGRPYMLGEVLRSGSVMSADVTKVLRMFRNAHPKDDQ